MSLFVLIFLSFIEGFTEFLPISSTGHLILGSAWLGIQDDTFIQSFNIIIQFGAIISVLVIYWRRFFPIRKDFYSKIFVAFLPAAVLGFLLKSILETLLGSVTVVAFALLGGGVLLIIFDQLAEKKLNSPTSQKKQTTTLHNMSFKQAFLIGCAQCCALIPGFSRAAASILGGLGVGLSRKDATEFSFFLAVPTLTAAASYKTFKILPSIQLSQAQFLILGTVLSFVFALLAIQFFIRLVQKFGLRHFGWYRIVVGGLILFVEFF